MMMIDNKLKQFILEHESDNVHSLALQASKYKIIDVQQAIQQIKGRQIAKVKIPSWYANTDIIYPRHLSMEQCSSEYTAKYKATISKGHSLVDLTGGFGVDVAFLSQNFEKVCYVEQQVELAEIVKANFTTLGLNITVNNTSSEAYLEDMDEVVDLIYIDPARRDDIGRKTVGIEDCTPNILELENLLEQKSRKTMIKLSPMLDIALACKKLNKVSEVLIISHQNECKELVFIKDNVSLIEKTVLTCINISNNQNCPSVFSFTKGEEDQSLASFTSVLGAYLYEPNSAILKAGAYKSISQRFNVLKLHSNSHLYTSDELIESFPGRVFKIVAKSSPDRKGLKQHIGDIQKANVATRNFPMSPQELGKKLNIKDGGDTYLFGTTMADEKKVLIICHKV